MRKFSIFIIFLINHHAALAANIPKVWPKKQVPVEIQISLGKGLWKKVDSKLSFQESKTRVWVYSENSTLREGLWFMKATRNEKSYVTVPGVAVAKQVHANEWYGEYNLNMTTFKKARINIEEKNKFCVLTAYYNVIRKGITEIDEKWNARFKCL